MFNSLCLIVKIAEIIPSDQTVPNPVNVWLRIHWAVIPLLGSVTARLDGSGGDAKEVIERFSQIDRKMHCR